MSNTANTERNAHFDYLLDLYLARKASDDQQQELRAMVENGFGDRFQQKFDEMINSNLSGEELSEQSSQEILANILMREQPVKVSVTNGLSKGWRWSAMAAAVAIFAVAGWFILQGNETTETTDPKLTAIEEQKGPVIYSGKRVLKLADGSTILMTDSSQVTVSEDFNTNTRTVSLTGKAYFDIAHNPEKEFQIITGDVTTTVLGTAFSIDAPADAERSRSVVVTVTRGKVKVGDHNQVYGLLTRNQQLKINLETKKFEQTSTDAEKVTAWKRDYLFFDNVTMEVAAAILKEKYNVNILYSTDAIKHCDFTATFMDGENLEQVLEVISTLAKVKYEMLPDGNVKLTGEGCALP